MAWKPASGDRRCVHKSSRTGNQCKLWGVPGTVPPTCATHGASAPQVRAAAERREADRKAVELAGRLDVEVPKFSSGGDVARYLLERVSRRSAQFGALADAHGSNAVYTDRTGREQVRAAFSQEQRWLDSLARVLAVMAQSSREAPDSAFASRVLTALSVAVNNVLVFGGRHPEIEDGEALAAEILGEVHATVRTWTQDRPDPEHPRAA